MLVYQRVVAIVSQSSGAPGEQTKEPLVPDAQPKGSWRNQGVSVIHW